MMKFNVPFLLLTAALLAAGRVHSAPIPPGELRIHTSIEVEFGTESGKVYQLQGSSNLVDWTSIGDPVFGVGRDVSRVFSTRAGGEVLFQSYRVDVSLAPTNSWAPWSLSGVTLSLDDQPANDRMRFTSETEGVDEGGDADPFTYVFSRVDVNSVSAEIRYAADRHDLLTLTFTGEGLGTWVREEYRKGKLKDRDVGVFTVVSGEAQGGDPGTGGGDPQPPVPAELPASISGLVYTFESGCGPVRLEFTTAGTGVEQGDDVGDNEPNLFTYVYSVTGTNAASLVLTFKPGRQDAYDLTFVSGAQGRFVRRELRDGQVKDTDRGTFSGSGAGQPGGNAGTGTMPQDTLSGLTYVMSDGETPDRLVFSSATGGTEFSDDVGDTEPNVFTYVYTVTGDGTASLVLTFKADRWDEYVLTFLDGNVGSFVRREFRKGVLKDTDTGIFSGSPTAN